MTVANSFHSRRAYLHLGGPNASANVAAATLTVASDGNYSVLARYEMPYRFEVPYRVQVAQEGKTVFDNVFGRRTNLKIWPFGGDRMGCGSGLVAECHWPYGATENVRLATICLDRFLARTDK
eukprot:COSAG06_NODE_1475_length_9337_cov_6.585733_13_plen_123_part_00